jgi:hypothetical protein
MCDEPDIYFTKALLAEQLRMKRARKETRTSAPQSTPAKPADAERKAVTPERVPA